MDDARHAAPRSKIYEDMMAGKIPEVTKEEMETYENRWKTEVAEVERNEELGLFGDRPRSDKSSSQYLRQP